MKRGSFILFAIIVLVLFLTAACSKTNDKNDMSNMDHSQMSNMPSSSP
jgi:hypothetical protein